MTKMSEAVYVRELRQERFCYAWCQQHYGGLDEAQARAKALAFYAYEPPEKIYRGLVFHETSWHWAMLHIKGEGYWLRHPELTNPPPAYDALQPDEEA